LSAHLILIDALNLIRRVYAVQERPFIQIKQDHDDKLSASTLKQVLFNTQKTSVNALIKIIGQHQPTHALAVFDSQQPCWRYQLFEGYKKGRKKMPDHLANKLVDIQDAFMDQGVDSLTSDEDEADDLIATLRDLFKTKTLTQWEEILVPADCCMEPIRTPDETLKHPHVKARQIVMQEGENIEVRYPAWVDGMPPKGRSAMEELDIKDVLIRFAV